MVFQQAAQMQEVFAGNAHSEAPLAEAWELLPEKREQESSTSCGQESLPLTTGYFMEAEIGYSHSQSHL